MASENEASKDEYEKKVEQLKEEQELKLQWQKELESNPEINAYLDAYSKSNKESFLSDYITYKYFWYRFGDMYQRHSERQRERWINDAHEQLEAIQQKKLFDFQCLWRAEQVSAKEVQICYDFSIWEKDVLNCPFIEDITEEDITLYQSFLSQPGLELEDLEVYEWQDYEEIKEEYKGSNDCSMTPEWYEFHNNRTGKGVLLLMGDIRGDKENFYMDLVDEERLKNNPPPKNDTSSAYKPTPYVNYMEDKFVEFFVQTFEDKETQELHRAYTKVHPIKDFDFSYYNELMEEIEDFRDKVPMPAHYDFKQALKKARDQYCLKKIAEHLPIAYQQYLLNKQMGFVSEKEKNYDWLDNLRDHFVKKIIEGRLLNGEEPNLDF